MRRNKSREEDRVGGGETRDWTIRDGEEELVKEQADPSR